MRLKKSISRYLPISCKWLMLLQLNDLYSLYGLKGIVMYSGFNKEYCILFSFPYRETSQIFTQQSTRYNARTDWLIVRSGFSLKYSRAFSMISWVAKKANKQTKKNKNKAFYKLQGFFFLSSACFFSITSLQSQHNGTDCIINIIHIDLEW